MGAEASEVALGPSDLALDRAGAAAARLLGYGESKRGAVRAAPVREQFIRSSGTAPPPLAAVLRGGRGGEVRLKLYLSILWIAAKAPYDVSFPARAWAELLDLPDAGRHGTRRISDAIDWLSAAQLIAVERGRGRAPKLTLLDDGGRGVAYEPPWAANERYIKLLPGFWTKGWLATLSGTAVAILIILLDQHYLKPNEAFWISPKRARELYDLSSDTWSKGLAELVGFGLVSVSRIPVDEAFSWSRVRNSHVVHIRRLSLKPDQSRAETMWEPVLT